MICKNCETFLLDSKKTKKTYFNNNRRDTPLVFSLTFKSLSFEYIFCDVTQVESVGCERHSVTVATSCVHAKAARSFSKSHLLGGLNLKTKIVKFDRYRSFLLHILRTFLFSSCTSGWPNISILKRTWDKF